ncbi:MAG: tandem-95 repeat protein [Candidatus Magnetomorum sp.]|nr:tandem-95 repeat protein [Candidatus Magnetomorum sp.]
MKYVNVSRLLCGFSSRNTFSGVGQTNIRSVLFYSFLAIVMTACVISSSLCQETPDMKIAPVNPAFQRYLQSLPQHVNSTVSPVKRSRTLRQSQDDTNLGFIPDPLIPEKHDANLSPIESFPERFDLRDPNGDNDPSDSPLPPVRQQGTCGSCWAFAVYGSLESHLKQSFQIEQDFSENHLRYMHGFDLLPCAGGNLKMSVAYLASNHGPILEVDDPYNDSAASDDCIDCSPSRYIDQAVFLPVRETVEDIAYIKKAIMEKGALYTSMFMNQGVYYDQTHHTYFYDDPEDTFNQSNHAVVIVGWDDQMTVTGAPGTGAFIVRNSQGAEWGDQGYFYVSYYDESIAMTRLGFFQDTMDSEHAFDTIYQYDPLGWTGGIGTGDGKDWATNVFTASEDIEITAVGFYATQSSTTYHIQIYENFEDLGGYNRPNGPLLDNEQTGFLTYSGYYYIPLNQSVFIRQGKTFAVTVAFESPDNAYPIPIEKPISHYTSQATALPGESYVSDYGDIYFDINHFSANSNVCIKAYAIKRNKTPPIADEKHIETDEDMPVSIALTGSSQNSQVITFMIRSYPSHGTLSGNLPELIYTPDQDFNGEDAFSVQVNDGFSTSESAIIHITVHPVNDPPVAFQLNLVVFEDTALPVLSAGIDPDGDVLTFNLLSPPVNGLIMGEFSDLTYMPAPNYHGVDSFAFQLSDGIESSEFAQVNLTVVSVDDMPTADDQTLYLLEDHAIHLTLTGTDVDSEQLNYQILSQPVHGQLTGQIPHLVYTPAPDYFGIDSLVYQISDGQNISSPVTIDIHITAVDDNHPPVAENQTFWVYAGQKQALTLTATDSDDDSLQYMITKMPENGILTGMGPVFQYTSTHLTADFDSFTYKVNDSVIDSEIATVQIVIMQSNHAPSANSLQIETVENTSISFELTADDPDNNPLTYILATSPLHGILSGTLPSMTYIPVSGYSGSDLFLFYVYDGAKKSSFATVRITIHAQASETKPAAYSQTLQVQEDTPISITLTGHDPNVDRLNYYLKSSPQHGQLTGTLPLVTYLPDADFSGSDIFYFQTGNGQELSDPVPITLTVLPVNDLPVGQNQMIITGKNQPIAFTLTVNDPDADSFAYHVIHYPEFGSLSGIFPFLIYTPDTDYSGTDSLVFTANDGQLTSDSATISITVLPFQVIEDDPQINKGAPVLSSISDQQANINTSTDIYFTVNDIESGVLTITCEYSNTSLLTNTGIEICSVETVAYTLSTAGSVDENITLTILPVTGGSGSSNVTITVTDTEDLSDSENFILWVLKPGAGYAIAYDGNDDYVDSNEDATFQLNNGTFEAWFYAYTITGSLGLWGKDKAGYFADIYSYIEDGAFKYCFDRPGNTLTCVVAETPIIENTWYHIAVWWGSSGMKVFINGELQTNSDPFSNGVVSPSSTVTIGVQQGESRYFNGIIDEARVWSTQRTQTQIQENMYKTLNGDESNLVSAWSFNEGSGSRSLDISSNHFNGTLVNSPQWITSTAPIGLTSVMLTETAGTKTFTDTGITMIFNTYDGSSPVQAVKMNDAPNVEPVGLKEIFDDQYWVIKRFPDAAVNANITFSISETLTSSDESDPSVLTLYTRGTAATGSWTAVTAASSVDATSGTVTFNNITSLGQFIIGRGNRVTDTLTLSKIAINENLSIGSTVGTFSNNDRDTDIFTYSLVAGAGADHNTAFTITGNTLKTNITFDASTQSAYNIRVEVSDGYSGDYEQTFTISINRSFISKPRMSNGGIGISPPDSNKGASVGAGDVNMNVSNPSASVFVRLSI